MTPSLLGRERELAVLDRMIDRVERGGGALVLQGEPGIGKSSLLAAASAQAEERGLLVLTTTGVYAEAHLAFAGLHQLLRPILSQADALPAPQRLALLTAFGITESMPPGLFLIALAALTLLGEAAARRPVLLVVEDAHWLDRSTCDVLAFVARRLASDPIILLTAVREGSETALDGAGLPELHLERLEDAAAGALLDAHAPDLPHAVRRRLIAESAGNPLALMELPLAWRTAHSDDRDALPAWLPLTSRLERAFLTRVSDMPEATRTLLLVAAVNDGGDLAEVLRAALSIAGRDVTADALAPALSARLIEVDGREIRFRHPLVRSAIHQEASVSARQAAHAALAEVLAGQPDRRVWHRAAATIEADENVAAELEATATRAQRRGAVTVAATALERAARLSVDPRRRGGRLLRAAELAVELGRRDLVHHLLRQAERLELGPLERDRLVWIREMIQPWTVGDAAAVRTLIEIADRVRAEADSDLALNVLWLAAERCWWADPGREMRERVVAAAEGIGSIDGDARVVGILAYAMPIERGRSIIDRLTRAAAAGEGDAAATRLFGSAALVVGAFDLASAFLASSAADLRAQGRLGHLARVLFLQAWAAVHLGDWATAVSAAEEAGRLADEAGDPLWAAGARVVKAMLAGMRGDVETAHALAGEAAKAVVPIGAGFMLAGVQMARAHAAFGSGRYADAYEHLRSIFDPADPAFHPVIRSWAIADFVEAAVHSGNADAVRSVMRSCGLLEERTPAAWVRTALRYARPLLATDDDAEALFQSALGPEMRHWPFHRARLQLAYGSWLRRQRRPADSRGPLRAARDTFDALGALPWGERARQELRASGETSHRRSPVVLDRLTPQELHIARLAADGLSNREIGARLYLSHRTVGSHLYRIFPKLGITARGQLRGVLLGASDSPA